MWSESPEIHFLSLKSHNNTSLQYCSPPYHSAFSFHGFYLWSLQMYMYDATIREDDGCDTNRSKHYSLRPSRSICTLCIWYSIGFLSVNQFSPFLRMCDHTMPELVHDGSDKTLSLAFDQDSTTACNKCWQVEHLLFPRLPSFHLFLRCSRSIIPKRTSCCWTFAFHNHSCLTCRPHQYQDKSARGLYRWRHVSSFAFLRYQVPVNLVTTCFLSVVQLSSSPRPFECTISSLVQGTGSTLILKFPRNLNTHLSVCYWCFYRSAV